jgi:DNA-binding NarL/FixJ family response regulator
MEPPRIILADEHLLVLEGLQRILQPDFNVVGAVRDGRTLVDLAFKEKPDLVLTETSLPLLNGIEAVIRIKRAVPTVHALFITRHVDRQHLSAALQSGASGYLTKDCSGSEVIAAIREILAGRCYITPLITADLFSTFREKLQSSPVASPTERQREVLQLIVEGHSLKTIASLLHISKKTVEYHKYTLMQELGLHTNTQLIQYAIDHGIAAPIKPNASTNPAKRLPDKRDPQK